MSLNKSNVNERVVSALNEISKFVVEYVGKKMEVWEIDFSVPHVSFYEISKRLSQLRYYRILLDVSGGMRIMRLISLGASIASVEPWRLEIKVWTEDLKGRHDLSFLTYITLRPALSELSTAVLNALVEGKSATLDELSSRLNKSKPTIFRAIKLLKSLGLVSSERRGRKDYFSPTVKGIIISQVSEASKTRGSKAKR